MFSYDEMLTWLQDQGFTEKIYQLKQLGYNCFQFSRGDTSYLFVSKKIYQYAGPAGLRSSGDNGYVSKAIDVQTGQAVAIKSAHAAKPFATDINITALTQHQFLGEHLAMENFPNHSNVIQIYHAAIGVYLGSDASAPPTKLYTYTVMEKAQSLLEVRYIFPDVKKIIDMLTNFYDFLMQAEDKKIIFTDLKPANILFNNGHLKAADFDDNIMPARPGARHNLAIFAELIHGHFFEDDNLNQKLKKELYAHARNTTHWKQREVFLTKLHEFVYKYSILTCLSEGNDQQTCRDQFAFFKGGKQTTQPRPSLDQTFFNAMLNTMLVKSVIATVKYLCEKLAVPKKLVDSLINVALIAFLFQSSSTYLPAISVLLLQGFNLVGLLSAEKNQQFTALISAVAQTVTTLNNDNINDKYNAAWHVFTATAGSIVTSELFDNIVLITDGERMKTLAVESRCSIC